MVQPALKNRDTTENEMFLINISTVTRIVYVENVRQHRAPYAALKLGSDKGMQPSGAYTPTDRGNAALPTARKESY
jgi:hypothetical protein